MKIEKIISVIFMSVVISAFAGFFALVFNVFNPAGISLIPKKEAKVTAMPKPAPVKKQEKSIVVPVQKPVKPTVEIKKAVTNEEKIVPVGEKTPITGEIANVDEKKATLAEVKKYFDSGKVIFVDARPEYAYVERHIKGAISLSASRFNFQYDQIKDQLKKDDLYFIYCSGVSCRLSDMTAGYMKEKGFKNVKVFFGGWDEWYGAGYPIDGLRVKKSEVTGE